ncbi:MAG: hypothetical protein CMJ89_10020 [Planctomycetes bacterium]|nr:hypothetical protein [Planctomycetota bacterium]
MIRLAGALLLAAPLSAQAGFSAHYFESSEPAPVGSPADFAEVVTHSTLEYPTDAALRSARWSGYVFLETAGAWSFSVTASDGVRLWVDDRPVIQTNVEHLLRDTVGSIRIDEAGWKRFRLEHSDRTPGNPLRLRYRIQGGKRRAIPAMAFCRNGGCPTELLTAGDDIVATSVDDPLVLHGNWAGQDGTLPAPSELNALRWRQVGGAPATIVSPNELETEILPSRAGVLTFEISGTTSSDVRLSDRVQVFLFAVEGPQTAQQVEAGPLGSTSPLGSVAPVNITGKLEVWQNVTFSFGQDVEHHEQSPVNPFLDLRFLVHFVREGDPRSLITVPGYFAADGNAAETGAESGNQWRAHFSPNRYGKWFYVASFVEGPGIGVDTDLSAGTPLGFNGQLGSFYVDPTDPRSLGFERKGLLRYTGEHHLRFSETGEYFLKAGSNSPENFLGYYEFDNTFDQGGSPNDLLNGGHFDGLHHFDAHFGDYIDLGIPTWRGDKGMRIFGAINYLASKGVNSLYFISYNIDGGDGREVWPWTGHGGNKLRFDVSKLDQWGRVFDHMTRAGVSLHFLTQEAENDHILDGGSLGLSRKLYYKEMVARFSHANALIWNLGEENDNSASERKAFAEYIREIDPYDHPITVLARGDQAQLIYNSMLGTHLEAISLQGLPVQGRNLTQTWIDNSSMRDRKWSVFFDEVGPANDGVVPDSVDPGHDSMRRDALWGGLMAQGGGAEWYFGYSHPHSDLDCEDFRSREHMWLQTANAVQFFQRYLPFERMLHNDALTSVPGAGVLAEEGEVYAIYLPNGGSGDLNLGTSADTFTIGWFDPLAGGALQGGTVAETSGPGLVPIGESPDPSRDWAAVVRRKVNRAPVITSIETAPEPFPGNVPFAYTVHVEDPDGIDDIDYVRTHVLTPQLVPIGFVDSIYNGGTQWALHSPQFPPLPPGTWYLFVVARDRSFAGDSALFTFEAE